VNPFHVFVVTIDLDRVTISGRSVFINALLLSQLAAIGRQGGRRAAGRCATRAIVTSRGFGSQWTFGGGE
jgi:hypothetical protein